jgi:effector-binding domain-containing protein
VVEDTLPGGAAVTTVHTGPYEMLPEATPRSRRGWSRKGLKPAGPPWENYITDPTAYPDPQDWKTEVCWPVRWWSVDGPLVASPRVLP